MLCVWRIWLNQISHINLPNKQKILSAVWIRQKYINYQCLLHLICCRPLLLLITTWHPYHMTCVQPPNPIYRSSSRNGVPKTLTLLQMLRSFTTATSVEYGKLISIKTHKLWIWNSAPVRRSTLPSRNWTTTKWTHHHHYMHAECRSCCQQLARVAISHCAATSRVTVTLESVSAAFLPLAHSRRRHCCCCRHTA